MNTFKALALPVLAAATLLSSQAYATPGNLPPPSGSILNLDGQLLPHSSFAQYSVNFTATNAVTNIMFAGRDDPGYTYLDNISVSNTNHAGVNLIRNGGFENGFTTSGGNALAPAGWTYQNPAGVEYEGYVGCLFADTYSGSCSWVTQARGAYDSISQSINTVIGETYQISFHASWSRASFISHETPTQWSEISTTGFPGPLANGVDITVYANAVSPSASVPEPAALGMFGLGTLLIGLFASLRRRFD